MFSRLMFVISVGSIVIICAALWHVLDTPVRGIVIEGDLSELERSEVRSTLSSGSYAGVLSSDLNAVVNRLKRLPWAREVNVRRLWPDKFIVSLLRVGPVARWGDRQFVSAYGDLLSLPDAHSELPQFKVALSTPNEAMKVYRLLSQILARENLTIGMLQQSKQAEWSLQIRQGPYVSLGSVHLNERMHRFLLLYRRVLTDEEKVAEYVDVRYANGVAVRFAEDNDPGEEGLLVAQHHANTPSLGRGNN